MLDGLTRCAACCCVAVAAAALEPEFQSWSVAFTSEAQPTGDVEVDVLRFPVLSAKHPLKLEYFNPNTMEWEVQDTRVGVAHSQT